MNPSVGVTDGQVDNGKTKTLGAAATATTATLIRNPYASAATRQRQNQLLVRQFPLEQLDSSSSLFQNSSAAQSLGRINENKKDPLLQDNNNNIHPNSNNAVEPPPAIQVAAKTPLTDSTAATAADSSRTLNIGTNVPQWQRLPSRTCSFESAEILTVTEACRYAALYRDKSVRITGVVVVVVMEQQISVVNTSATASTETHESSAPSCCMLQKEGYRSFFLADPLASPLLQTSSASLTPSAAAAAAAGEIMSTKPMPGQGIRQPHTLRKQHPFKPRIQEQSSSTTTSASLSNNRLGRPFRVPVLRRPAAAAAAALAPLQPAVASAAVARRNPPPPPQQQPLPPQQNSININGSRNINQHSLGVSTESVAATTSHPPFGNKNKRPASQISTTKTPSSQLLASRSSSDCKQPSTARVNHQYNNKMCVWFHPDQVPIMQALKIGDLVMVIGEIRQVATTTLSSSAATASCVVGGSVPQQYILVARICTNANGTNMKLHHQALLVRRRHLLRNSNNSSSTRMVVVNNPYKLQKPLNSNGDDAKEGDMEVLLQLRRPGCGPPPYNDFDSF
jgi:Telomere-capping, CST complex subunit